MNVQSLHIGVLALQGDFERHLHQIEMVAARPIEVRTIAALSQVDGLIIPGGESTTMSYLLDKFDMRQALLDFARTKPVWGTCAGMIMMAQRIDDNQAGVEPLALIDIDIVRNGYGRQVFSFQEPLSAQWDSQQHVLTASFIRAPRITRLGEEVEVLARYGDDPVLVRQGQHMATSFHTELDDDTALLQFFINALVLPAHQGASL